MFRRSARALALLFLPALAAAYIYKPVLNIQTGRPDLITPLNTTTVQAGANITITPNADGSITIDATGGGGTGSPSAPLNSIQFNNGGSFGGSSDAKFSATTGVSISSLTVNSSTTINGPVTFYAPATSQLPPVFSNPGWPATLDLLQTQFLGNYGDYIRFVQAGVVEGQFGMELYNFTCSDGITTCATRPFAWKGSDGNVALTFDFNHKIASGRLWTPSVNYYNLSGNMSIGNWQDISAAPLNGLMVEGNTIVGSTNSLAAYTTAQFQVIGSTANIFSVIIGTSSKGPYDLSVSTLGITAVRNLTVSPYGITTSTFTGAGLTTCGDATHAVGYNATTGLFSCQSVTGSGGSGGGFSMAIGTGTAAGVGPYAEPLTSTSSVRSILIFDSTTFNTQFTAGGTTYVTPKSSSFTLQGVITAASLGAITGNQNITVTGDSAGSGTTAITLTAAATQANIKTFTSSITVQTQLQASTMTAVLGNNSVLPGITNSPLQVIGNVNSYLQANIQNFSNGNNASGDLVLTSNMGGNTTFYANLGINSSGFNQSSFSAAPSSWTYLFSSDAGMLLGAGMNASDPAASLVFATSGTATSNIRMVITSTGPIRMNDDLGITSTSGANSFFVSSGSFANPMMSVSSTPAITPQDFLISVSSANGILIWGVQNNGHVVSSGTTPSLSSCGTGPAITGTDYSGNFTGGTAAAGCTLTFNTPFLATPTCVVSERSMSVVNAFAYTPSVTALTVTQTGFGTSTVDYICTGTKAL